MYALNNDLLIQDIREGKVQAFEWVFREFYPVLCVEARGYISEKELIEELVGDVLCWLWLHRKEIDIQISLRAYLIKATHNACLRCLRQKTPEIIELNDSHQISTLYGFGESPLEYIISKELSDQINQAVEELPPQYKQVFIYSRYNELTYQQIAEKMNISVNAVKLYMKKALARLRSKL
ncbi:MAG: RNA polymerase sigma-70 factor [Tannerellaceae bacterium]|nr:RNA polymerase sigma-70 factor [Tannerellaceae bacterium]